MFFIKDEWMDGWMSGKRKEKREREKLTVGME